MSWWCSMFFPGNTNFKDNCTKRYVKGISSWHIWFSEGIQPRTSLE
jgi:hypothetical protein